MNHFVPAEAAQAALITVDLSAYRRNLADLAKRVAPAVVMAVVKADAYGHGLILAAQSAVKAGVGWLGCLDIDTGLVLRGSGIPDRVRVFAWLLAPRENYLAAIEAAVDLGVSTLAQLEQISKAGANKRARVHLKIDTGLHRNGASVEDWPALVARAVALGPQIDLVGVWTHIAEASEHDDTLAIDRFHAAIAVAENLGANFEVCHLAASAAAFARIDARFDLVRIGAFGFGISPGDGVTPKSLGIEPVMTLTAPVIAVRDGVATVAIGYGDGILSKAAGRAQLSIGGNRHLIETVSLDRLTVLVGERELRVGETAVLFGGGGRGEPTLQHWADELGTIGEEIVTRLSPLVPRHYLP